MQVAFIPTVVIGTKQLHEWKEAQHIVVEYSRMVIKSNNSFDSSGYYMIFSGRFLQTNDEIKTFHMVDISINGKFNTLDDFLGSHNFPFEPCLGLWTFRLNNIRLTTLLWINSNPMPHERTRIPTMLRRNISCCNETMRFICHIHIITIHITESFSIWQKKIFAQFSLKSFCCSICSLPNAQRQTRLTLCFFLTNLLKIMSPCACARVCMLMLLDVFEHMNFPLDKQMSSRRIHTNQMHQLRITLFVVLHMFVTIAS